MKNWKKKCQLQLEKIKIYYWFEENETQQKEMINQLKITFDMRREKKNTIYHN